MTQSDQWWQYVRRLLDAHDWTLADLSRASSVDLSVIGRFRTMVEGPKPSTVRKIAHAFRRPVSEAIIAAGHYTAEEMTGEGSTDPDLTVISDEVLRDEVYRRMSRQPPRPGPRGPRPPPQLKSGVDGTEAGETV